MRGRRPFYVSRPGGADAPPRNGFFVGHPMRQSSFLKTKISFPAAVYASEMALVVS